MEFPLDFVEKYTDLLGKEADNFFASFDQEAVSAYRTNLLTMRLVWSILRNLQLKWSLKLQLQPREVVS